MVVNDGLVCTPARGPNSTSQDLYDRTAALGAATVVTLAVGAPYMKVGLVRFKVKRVAGAGASFTPYLFSKSGVTTPLDISQEFAGISTLNAVLFDPAFSAPVVMQCDGSGNLYMMLAPNAGADNTYDYCLRFFKYD